LYSQHRNGESELDAEIASGALTSLHLYLGTFAPLSPLTVSPLQKAAMWDPESIEFSWLDLALQGRSPTSITLEQSYSASDLETESLTWALCSSHSKRMEELLKLYPRIPCNETRARAAFVLSYYFLHEKGDLVLAEKISFESLWILDHITVSLRSLILSLIELSLLFLIMFQ
jgi:hypothetical protein